MRRIGRGWPDGLGGLVRRIGRPARYDRLGGPCPPVENFGLSIAKTASFHESRRSSYDKLGGAKALFCYDGLGGPRLCRLLRQIGRICVPVIATHWETHGTIRLRRIGRGFRVSKYDRLGGVLRDSAGHVLTRRINN